MTALYRLPKTHALDWHSRTDFPTSVEATTARTVTLALSPEALDDLVGDALYYAAEMDRENTGDRDYRPAARACLRALTRLGVTWEVTRGVPRVLSTGEPARQPRHERRPDARVSSRAGRLNRARCSCGWEGEGFGKDADGQYAAHLAEAA